MSGRTLWVLYNLALALWIGGMAIYTFLITPAIFRSYGRDEAGRIVGILFPGYFLYKLVLSLLALAFFLPLPAETSFFAGGWRSFSLALILLAIVLNAVHRFLLYPAILRVKKEVRSFEADAGSASRRKFGRLHAVSMVLNMLVLATGIALFILALKKLP